MSHDKPQTRGAATATVIRKSLTRLMIATIVVYLAVVGVVVYIYFDGKKTNDALCSLRGDLVQRITTSVEWLKQNPNGAAGISTETILQSLSGQQRTIIALSNLECGGEPFKVPQIPPQRTP